MKGFGRRSIAALAALLAVGLLAVTAAPEARTVVVATAAASLRIWDARIDQMVRDGDLRLGQRDDDTVIPGRTHERFTQHHRGVPVFGGDVTRQVTAGLTTSVFGTLYAGIDIDTAPALSADEAASAVEKRAGTAPRGLPTLVILPEDDGGYALAWRAEAWRGSDLVAYFLDAKTGKVLLEYSDLKTQAPPQSATGTGTGVLGDTKKIDASLSAGAFIAWDRLRPASLITYDMKGDVSRLEAILDNSASFSASDVAASTNNVWSDGPVVDAHYYCGRTYDYFYNRFGRRGLDDKNHAVWVVVHPIDRTTYETNYSKYSVYFTNAFYAGGGLVVMGEGLPPDVTSNGRSWNYTSAALDIVAHELAHGVTQYTSNLIYRNESGALNEAFSDIMATGVEFFAQPEGSGQMKADYLEGEDAVSGGGIRSLPDPASKGHPDHYSKRFIGTTDNGYVHANSLIASHAYYLAIEGGTNRTSGLSVAGVGHANREQMEKVFYRAFAYLMPSAATFSIARAATIQAAVDLYGAAGAAERAVTQAWAAVGVQ